MQMLLMFLLIPVIYSKTSFFSHFVASRITSIQKVAATNSISAETNLFLCVVAPAIDSITI